MEMDEDSLLTIPRTVDEVFRDFKGRRAGIPKALTTGKKTTRHWEAWTHQEEENFFNALRQVGKNFEKITSRVQSKNKDQVRHYYYRLIKRMNKLLGPGFVLDAKNSKDVNSAMLRWWSLLEKHSCPASKLHLKPRRFKNFVTALEHQLLKDRSKATKKRAQVAEPLSTVATPRSILGKSNMESLEVVAAGDSRSEKSASTRGSAGKRKVESRGNRTKGEPSRSSRQRKKASEGSISAAAYKRWEKAASVGMTLVAEAAEQLERAAVSEEIKQVELSQTQIKSCSTLVSGVHLSTDKEAQRESPRAFSGLGNSNKVSEMTTLIEGCTVSQVVKLKLQLFPIDDFTRKSMEQDGLNPHLELTLKSRKAISSVLQHLTQKWGRASAASGELRLFPFNVQWKNLLSCQSWSSRDVSINAEQVHAFVGKPPVFRLKYGWIPHSMFESKNTEFQESPSMLIAAGSCADKQGNGSLETANGVLRSDKQSSAFHTSLSMPLSSALVLNGSLPHSGINNTAEVDTCEKLCNTYTWHAPFSGNRSYNTTAELPSPVPGEFVVNNQAVTLPSASTQELLPLSGTEEKGKNGSDEKDFQFPQCFIGKSNISVQSEAASVPDEAHRLNNKTSTSEEKTKSKSQEGSAHCPWIQEESTDGFIRRLWGVEDPSNNGTLVRTEMDWIDSFTNISVGELLNEASRAGHSLMDTGHAQQMMQCLDSFDAAVAAQGADLSKIESRSLHQFQTPVWDGEDTCDGFSFHKLFSQKRESIQSSSNLENLSCREIQKDSAGLITDFGSLEAWKESFKETEIRCQELKGDLGQSSQQNIERLSAKDLVSQELYWADSLGAFDLAAPSLEHAQGQDVLLSDDLSLGSLGGCSLDAFLALSSQGNHQKVLSMPGSQIQSFCSKGKGNCS